MLKCWSYICRCGPCTKDTGCFTVPLRNATFHFTIYVCMPRISLHLQSYLQFEFFSALQTLLLTAGIGISQVVHRGAHLSTEINTVTSVQCYWLVSSCMRQPPTLKKEKWVYSVNMWSILHVEIFKSINLWHQDHCGHRVGDVFNFSPRSACKEILLMWCLLYVYHSSLSGCNRVTFQAMLCSVEVKF